MDKNISILILAAGAGTRMKSNTPKVLHTISGKPMLYYSIKEAKRLTDDITVILYHKADIIKQEMDRYFDGIKYHIQDHLNYPGTGGAIRNIDFSYQKVLVLNGDMPLISSKDLLPLIDTNSAVSLSILRLQSPFGYGRVEIDNGNIIKIIEEKDCTKEQLQIDTVNGGVYCFDRDFLQNNIEKLDNNNIQKEYYITDLIGIATSQNLIVTPVLVDEKSFKGVNSKLDLSKAEVIHQNKIKESLMKDGVIMRLPDTIYIEEGVDIKGECVIENGVTILGDTTIISSHIKAHSVIEDSKIEDSSIGPFARIRPNSNIKDTHIGNFVEVKKSTLDGVKAGHLSYLGDSNIKSGTNIGAGTITCNYDGIKKYKTNIGQNVFVGSGSLIVSPIDIESNSMVGAGSVVTKDIKDGELFIRRSDIKIIPKYYYKHFKKTK